MKNKSFKYIGVLILLIINIALFFSYYKTKDIRIMVVLIGLFLLVISMILKDSKFKGVIFTIFIYYTLCCFTGVGIYISKNALYYKNNGKKTDAIIYNIDKDINYITKRDSDGYEYEEKSETCTYYIKYNVNKEEYKNKITNQNCNKKMSDKITIYYLKENPNKILKKGNTFIGLGIALFGSATIILLSIRLIEESKPSKR